MTATGQAELAMALAHAGYVARGVRGLPAGDAVETLFEGARGPAISGQLDHAEGLGGLRADERPRFEGPLAHT